MKIPEKIQRKTMYDPKTVKQNNKGQKMTTSFHMSCNEKLLDHQNKVALKRMKTFHIQAILFLFLTTSALLCSAPFDYLPQVQECSTEKVSIPLTTGKFHLHVSKTPEKSSPFIQALIHDKITVNIYPEDNSAPIIHNSRP